MAATTAPLTAATDLQDPAAQAVFQKFKEQIAAEGLLTGDTNATGDDVTTGVEDDATLGRFIKGHAYNIDSAFKQYTATRAWREKNHLVELYSSIDVQDYEETRKMYTHWTGRRDLKGVPICWFEIGQLTSSVMSDYTKSCEKAGERPWPTTESEAMLRLFCTNENLIRFVLPLCSAVKSRPEPSKPITDTTCIVDISGVGLMQFWRLKNHMSAASTLATAHYPETLGKTYVIGAPGFFPTIWGWLSRWFNQNTISKIVVVPFGQEFATLSQAIDARNIPQKYGGEHEFDFGMPPDLDGEIERLVTRFEESDRKRSLPLGPIVWARSEDGRREALAVGSDGGKDRRQKVFTLL